MKVTINKILALNHWARRNCIRQRFAQFPACVTKRLSTSNAICSGEKCIKKSKNKNYSLFQVFFLHCQTVLRRVSVVTPRTLGAVLSSHSSWWTSKSTLAPTAEGYSCCLLGYFLRPRGKCLPYGACSEQSK